MPGRGWVVASELRPGDGCVDRDGLAVRVLSTELDPEKVPVYNIEVEHGHTYFIGKGGLSLLVHNDCQWHHLLPNQCAQDFIDAGIDKAVRDSAEYGLLLDHNEHMAAGKGIHQEGWNTDWKEFFKEFENKHNRKPTKDEVLNQLETMKKDPKYKTFLDAGAPAAHSKSQWNGLKTDEKAKAFDNAKKKKAIVPKRASNAEERA